MHSNVSENPVPKLPDFGGQGFGGAGGVNNSGIARVFPEGGTGVGVLGFDDDGAKRFDEEQVQLH